MSKGFTDAVKYRAMELWARGGMSSKDVSRALAPGGPSPGTVEQWRLRKEPQDWELFRDDIRQQATKEAHRRLLEHRASVHLTHFEDLDRIRKHIMMSLSVAKKEGNGAVTWAPREDLKPKDTRDAAQAYAAVQRGQRLALGIPSDYVIAEELTKDGKQGRLADELAMMGIAGEDLERIGEHFASAMSRVEDDGSEVDNTDVEDALQDDEDELAEE